MGLGALLRWLGSVWALSRYGIPALPILLRLYRQRTPAQREAERMLRGLLHSEVSAPRTPPLSQIGTDLYEVDTAALCELAAAPSTSDVVTVVHLLGSGETRLSPLPGLRALIAAEPALAAHRHLIIDTPTQPAAFLGPDAFAERLTRNLGTVLQGEGPLLLFGLSRGAVASLEIACRVGVQQQRPVAALALSPPARADYTWPKSVVDIASLEPATSAVAELGWMPGPIARFTETRMRHTFMAFSAWVMAELSFACRETLSWVACETMRRPPTVLCLRAVREFVLLTRVPDTELRHAYNAIADRVGACPHLKLTMCWGENDVWIPAHAAKERIDGALERRGVDSERMQTHVLPGWNHGIGRQLDNDFGPLAERVQAHIEWLQQRHTEMTEPGPNMVEEQHDARRG